MGWLTTNNSPPGWADEVHGLPFPDLWVTNSTRVHKNSCHACKRPPIFTLIGKVTDWVKPRPVAVKCGDHPPCLMQTISWATGPVNFAAHPSLANWMVEAQMSGNISRCQIVCPRNKSSDYSRPDPHLKGVIWVWIWQTDVKLRLAQRMGEKGQEVGVCRAGTSECVIVP